MAWYGPQRSLPRQFAVLAAGGITPACFSAGDGDVFPVAIGVDVQNLGLLPRPAAVGVLFAALVYIQTAAAVGGLAVILQNFHGVLGVVYDVIAVPLCGQSVLEGVGSSFEIGVINGLISRADVVFGE